MSRKWMVIAGVLLLVVSVTGCKKKAPETTETIVQEEIKPEPVEVAPTPTPVVADTTPAWLTKDLESVTKAAYAKGLLGDVYFDFDRFELKDEARDRLAKNAAFLKENGDFTLTLEGHCDERGTNEYNLALGEKRTNTAKDYLASLGIPASRIRTISYGEERPVCREGREDCWWQNRRAHFLLSGRTSG